MFLEPVICSTSSVVCVRDVLGACYLQYQFRGVRTSVVCVRDVLGACYLQHQFCGVRA